MIDFLAPEYYQRIARTLEDAKFRIIGAPWEILLAIRAWDLPGYTSENNHLADGTVAPHVATVDQQLGRMAELFPGAVHPHKAA